MSKDIDESKTLVAAAKAIGKTVGKIAALTGAGPDSPEPSTRRKPAAGRLPKKAKARLPRREKKAQKKNARKTTSKATKAA